MLSLQHYDLWLMLLCRKEVVDELFGLEPEV